MRVSYDLSSGWRRNDLEDVLALAAVQTGLSCKGLLHAAHTAGALRPTLWPSATWNLYGKTMVNSYFAAYHNPTLDHAKAMFKSWPRIQLELDIFFASSGEIPDAVPPGFSNNWAHKYFMPSAHIGIVQRDVLLR